MSDRYNARNIFAVEQPRGHAASILPNRIMASVSAPPEAVDGEGSNKSARAPYRDVGSEADFGCPAGKGIAELKMLSGS